MAAHREDTFGSYTDKLQYTRLHHICQSKNLEVYIAKSQKVITSVKCGQGEALKAIKAIDISTGESGGMAFSKDTNLFYKQYNLDYKVQGNGEHIIEADRLKLNIYFDIHKRADDLARVQMAITTQT